MKTRNLHLSAAVLILLASFSVTHAGTWTTPELVSEVSTSSGEADPYISNDGLTLYFTRGNASSHYWNQLYQATRLSPSDPFSNVTIINELACSEHETNSWVLPDNLVMYFARTWQIRESMRASTTLPWGSPQNLTSLNNTGPAANPKVSNDGLSIVFNVFPDHSTAYLYTANRSDTTQPFTNIRALNELNTGASAWATFLSADGLTLYFNIADNGVGYNYVSTRPNITGTFGSPQLLNYWPAGYGLNCFTSDGKTAYLGYNGDIYVSYYSDDNLYVDVNSGDDLNDGTSSQSAFATIQKAIDSAPDGYTIFVKPGVYSEPIYFQGKAVTLQGIAGPEGVPVLEAADDFAVSFINNEGQDSVLKNIVIKNSFMAVFVVGSSPTISNVTIVDNIYGINAYAGGNPDISNNIFWNNSESDLLGCEARYCLTAEDGEGNICGDPMFVDPNNNDYHLKSQRGRYWPEHDVWVLDKVTSPCIDAGDPNYDKSEEPMPNGGRINMGAYGGTAYASMNEMPFPEPDYNKDGIINESDLADLIDQWLAISGWTE